ncbi:MAG: carboxylating nicotinate-nucleotide diphosphorylase [Thermoproteota archaeon]|nr:carboxylating nicotinate-nucleotide diphosphorylase [Thermoproteota archaeon]
MNNMEAFLGIRGMLATFLQEDLGARDITSDTIIPADLKANAEILSKSQSAIVCGLEEASVLFDICGCKAELLVKDGSNVVKGTTVMDVSGRARAILKAERTALNLIMRMSGIATETRKIADLAKGITILATRKTAPGLRYFDKKAVVLGGGCAHRMRLDEMVLIKDNHLALVSDPEECIRLSRKKIGSSIRIECEARTKEEALKVVSAGADIVMLDNFTPKLARETIKQITRMGLRKSVMIELSGGIDQRNIQDYLEAKPDFISLGSITHSPKAADFSLEIRK